MLNGKEIPVNKSNEQINYEIEIILNENLYKKKIITEDIYKKTNERLLKLIEICRTKHEIINNSS